MYCRFFKEHGFKSQRDLSIWEDAVGEILWSELRESPI